jgi:hypothetical protein
VVKLAVAAAAGLIAVLVLFTALIGAIAGQLFAGTSTPGAAVPLVAAGALDIPGDYLALYVAAAATCPGLDWSTLAAVGAVESDHGRSQLPGIHSGENPAHAAGPMQFLAPTFDSVVARRPPPPGGAQPPSRYVPHDAIHAAASYLCDNGARDGRDLRAALFTYNHSNAYVDDVLARAARYRDTAARAAPNGGTDDAAAAGDTVTQWPAEQATVPDPAGAAGRVTPRLAALYQALADRGAITAGASCWGERPDNPNSDHPRGKACDITVNPNDPADVARGWDIAHWLTIQQTTFGIRNIIWQGQIWTASHPTWETYESSAYGCPNPANVTGCHFDHLHTSIF